MKPGVPFIFVCPELKVTFLLFALCFLVSLSDGCGKRQSPTDPRQAESAPVLTPQIKAGAQDLFEDVTTKAGITFVHQFCDTKIGNILESNGAGGAWLDYDGDGFMDLYLVNSGPLEGVTHHSAGTARQPNRLYRNRGDGTFEDVTRRAGLQ